MYAIIATGGKQYKVAEGDSIKIEKIEAEVNIEAARGKLADILCNYQGYKGCTLILVFDAYKVVGNVRKVSLLKF